MSNIIPPMLSSTPPPMDDNAEEEEDDEFGDFNSANLDYSINLNQPSIQQSDSEWTDQNNYVTNYDISSVKELLPQPSIILSELQDTFPLDQDDVDEFHTDSTESIGSKDLQQENASQRSCESEQMDPAHTSTCSRNSKEASPIMQNNVLDRSTTIEITHERSSSSEEMAVFQMDRTFTSSTSDELLLDDSNCVDDISKNVTVNKQAVGLTQMSTCDDLDADEFSNQSQDILHSINNQAPNVSDDDQQVLIVAKRTCSECLDEKLGVEVSNKCCDSFTVTSLDEINRGFEETLDLSFTVDNTADVLLNTGPSNEACEDKNCATVISDVQLDQDWDDDEFSDFACSALSSKEEPSPFIVDELDCDLKNIIEPKLPDSSDFDDDDFDNFESASFPVAELDQCTSIVTVVTTLFPGPVPPFSSNVANPVGQSIVHASLVWTHLQDVNTSNALSYQWANSAANKLLLTSLGIDARNILFGPKWNISVPRFAANLGISPLEPVRASSPQQLIPTQETTQQRLQAVEVPANIVLAEEIFPDAQFDWNSSGLVNPLDYPEKDGQRTSSEGNRALDNGKVIIENARMGSKPARILCNLPDMSFMRAESLVFPQQHPHSLR